MNLDRLLERSEAFAAHLFGLVAHIEEFDGTAGPLASRMAAVLSIEHAHALCVLFAGGAANSACALLRLQFEALVRSAWLGHVASPAQVERALQPLGLTAQQAAKNLPGAQEMLEELEKKLQVHPGIAGLVKPLLEIRAVSWRPMNSYVHAGIHPLVRTEGGFPYELADQVVRNSNGMLHLAFRQISRLAVKGRLSPVVVDRAYLGFEDCLPMSHASG
jgi:hypothetical protein